MKNLVVVAPVTLLTLSLLLSRDAGADAYILSSTTTSTVLMADDETEAINSRDISMCDESKCRANRTHGWVDDETEFTCWVPLETTTNSTTSLVCADGYVGRIIPNAPTKDDGGGHLLQWYTCCPPDYKGAVTQQCSDIACSSPDWEGGGNCWADGFQEPMSCSSAEFRYPRKTELRSLIYIQYLCCTKPSRHWFMEELLLARAIWMVLSGITFCTCLVFIMGLLSSKKVRRQGYNLYLLFLAIPDALANLFILVRNSLTITGAPVSPTVHIFLASFEYFYASTNMWLNGVIVSQVHYVLRKSFRCVRVPQPSVGKVCAQAAAVYFFASIWFAWSFFLYSRGLVLFDLDDVVPIWIATRAIMVGPPLFYVIYVCVDIWYRKLLPKRGRTRVLSLYFLRVIIVFFVTWVPYFVLYEIAWNVTHSRWMVFVSYYLGSIQGFLSVMVALGKPDINRAVVEFACCACVQDEQLDIMYRSWTARFSGYKARFSTYKGPSSAEETNIPDGLPATSDDANAPVVVGKQEDYGDSNAPRGAVEEGVDAEAPVVVEGGSDLSVNADPDRNVIPQNGDCNTRRSQFASTHSRSRRKSFLESYHEHMHRKIETWETEDVWELHQNNLGREDHQQGNGGISQIEESSDDDTPPHESNGQPQASAITRKEKGPL